MVGKSGANPADSPLSASGQLASRQQRRIGIVLPEASDVHGANLVAEAFNLASRIAGIGPDGPIYEVSFLFRHGAAILRAPSIQPCTNRVFLPRNWTFNMLFVATSNPFDRSVRPKHPAPWFDAIREDATEVIHLDDNSPRLDVAGCMRSADTSYSGSQATDDALSAALTVIRRDVGDALARRVTRELSIVFQPLTNIALDETETGLPERVRRAARWLANNCGLPVNPGDAAAVVGMNVSSFARHFKQELGVSPSGYLLDLRLQIARQLLVGTDLPIDNVARRAGMRSRAKLARQFRRHLKILPREYRAFHRDDGVQDESTISGATKVAQATC
ncbi:helix-turn-helix domain-containing protein [Paraburkholderia phenoliruptrix]|uniref:Helix-turn-helix domain-containing protein n=1 Tax=Paraburkholderia phenoliruptrix TaxID=252970 RepID=A0ABV3WEM5_9BURK